MDDLQSVIFCDRHGGWLRFFRSLNPRVVETQPQFDEAFRGSTPRTLWLSWHTRELFEFASALAVRWPLRRRGSKSPMLLALERIGTQQELLLRSIFTPVIEAAGGTFLPKEELAQALSCPDAADLALGGWLDAQARVVTLVRGDVSLPPLVVPFAAFAETIAGVKPDFGDFAVVDHGRTIRLGRYEAAFDALLYELDAGYRKRQRARLWGSERSFGASLRRLRLQRGLSQTDFQGITEKEIGRIERGEVNKPRAATLARLARALAVAPEEIETF